MANIKKLVPNQVLYTITRSRMGNTTIKTVSVHPIKVKSIDLAKLTVVASFNGGSDRTYSELRVKSWKIKKPTLVRLSTGNYRLANREELSALNASSEASLD